MGEWKEKYLQLWEKLTKRQRYMAIGGVALLLVVVLGVPISIGICTVFVFFLIFIVVFAGIFVLAVLRFFKAEGG